MEKENKKFFILSVLGPPGSGKGTQIKLLAEKFGFEHFISSKIGKDYIASHNDSETLKQKARYDAGLLWDAEWMLKVIKEKTEEFLFHRDGCTGIIYDGSPRTLFEAENLYNFLVEKIGKENIRIIEINVSDNELLSRIEKRLICDKNNNHVFIQSDKLNVGSICLEGDGVLQKRDLDNPEIFKVRIDTYKNETIPALDFLKKHHNVITVNGDNGVEEVNKEILSKLNL